MKPTSPAFRRLAATGAACLLAGVVLGALLFRGGRDAASPSAAPVAADGPWTCSMHPQIQQPKPGKCPICAMDLIPVSRSGSQAGGEGTRFSLSPGAAALAAIRTAPVTRERAEAEIRMVGKVDFDETRVRVISAPFPARIERLYVDYVGIPVSAGDHLAQVYSPELLTAQSELLSAQRSGRDAGLIREKLRLWGLPEERIRSIEAEGSTFDRLDIDAPAGGVVITRHVRTGDYVDTGDQLFEVADLSRVWVQLAAYEADLPWLRYGQPASFEAEAVPGAAFSGIVSFIAPTVDAETRAVKIRVTADNADLRLKPGMYVRATVSSTLASGGRVISPELAEKWISPMHPEVIRDNPGPCPVCGMDLVRAEDLGYSIAPEDDPLPLVVPASAVLVTGKRAVVYVEDPEAPDPTYEGREITLGPRAGDVYLVEAGLSEGERVVVEGAFKIDSALQIQARPSMMLPREIERPAHEAPQPFLDSLASLAAASMQAGDALASDDLPAAAAAASTALAALSSLDPAGLEPEAAAAWTPLGEVFAAVFGSLSEASEIEAARTALPALTEALADAFRAFGPPGEIRQAHCPMAFGNQGGDWFQEGGEIRNPYFGARMLKCGEIVKTWRPAPDEDGSPASAPPAAPHVH